MHTYDNLKNRKITTACAACAESMSFIHVRAPDESQMRRVLETRSLEVSAGTRNSKTVESEKALGIRASVYFYAGRAYPAPVGTVVYSVPLSDWGGSRDASLASPFDTGALHHDHLLLRWRDYSDGGKVEYLSEHTSTLEGFSTYFSSFLSAYFESPPGYWVAPNREIDGASFTRDDDWRNWTFELRTPRAANVRTAKWYFNYESHSQYSELLAEGVVEPLPPGQYEIAAHPADRAEADARRRAV